MSKFVKWFPAVFFSFSVSAQEAPCEEPPATSARGIFTFLWENDVWGGSDENYTNGNRISFLSRPQSHKSFHGKIVEKIFDSNCNDTVLYNVALGQSMYTGDRDDRGSAELRLEQHPFAGWATAEYSLVYGKINSPLVSQGDTPTDWQTISLQLGVVGPLAQQKLAQDSFHDLIDDDHFLGWVNQIGNEPAVLLSYERRWQHTTRPLTSTSGFDFVPNVSASLGNVLVQASAGFFTRIGTDLEKTDIPVRIHPATSGTSSFGDKFGWSLFAGMEGRVVGRNIFLDGNTLKESARVEKNFAVYDRLLGFALHSDDWQFAFTFVERSEEFITQGEKHRFGSASISYQF